MKSVFTVFACLCLTACGTTSGYQQQPLTPEQAQLRLQFLQMMMQNNSASTQYQQQNLLNTFRSQQPAPITCTTVKIGDQFRTRCY